MNLCHTIYGSHYKTKFMFKAVHFYCLSPPNVKINLWFYFINDFVLRAFLSNMCK